MGDVEKLIEALRLNESDFNEDEIRANSWKILANPAIKTEIDNLYEEGLNFQKKQNEERMKKELRDAIDREKKKWFRPRETENSVENLEKRTVSINEFFEEMEKNFEHPSSFSAEKFERVANSILEQKKKLAEAVKNLTAKLDKDSLEIDYSTNQALEIEEIALLKLESEVMLKETFVECYEKARPTLESTLSVFQQMPEKNKNALKEKLESDVKDKKEQIELLFDQAERLFQDQTIGLSVVRRFLRKVQAELTNCQEYETKLNDKWEKLKHAIETDTDRMRNFYVRLKALEPLSQEIREEMNILLAKINDCQRVRSAGDLDAKSEFVKQSPFYRALTNLCEIESPIVRKDDLASRLQVLESEKEAMKKKKLSRNAERADEIFREYKKAKEEIPPLQLNNNSGAILQMLASMED
ncbi:unnamed protein product [Oikopleura dioica]|uniref:Uncharacterized protein n=1 Tax=Oikopleura dioica TaxID=34765 RepID=E4XQA9_OIKDI|nr:unnamed protein product [Oikopleura dioica]